MVYQPLLNGISTQIFSFYTYTHIYIYIYVCVCVYIYRSKGFDYHIYPTPPLGQDMTQGQFFKWSLTGLNSEFSFSTSYLTKAEEPSLPYYLPIVGGRIIGFICFPRVLVVCEMQSVSSRIWTRVAVSISYDDNHYTTGTSTWFWSPYTYNVKVKLYFVWIRCSKGQYFFKMSNRIYIYIFKRSMVLTISFEELMDDQML